MGIGHCQGLKEFFGQKGAQIFTAGNLYHGAQDICVVSVDVFLSRMLVQRQGRHPPDGLENRFRSVGKVPSLKTRLLPLIPRRTAAIAYPGSVGKQVANGDWPSGVFQATATFMFSHSGM